MTFPLTESLICLASRLRKTEKNDDGCSILSRTYKPIQLSKNTEKKEATEKEIRALVSGVLFRHREDILNRDFSFLSSDPLVITEVDIGLLYFNTLSEGDDEKIKSVTTELLQLFYHAMNEEDQAIIKSKYKKRKDKKPKPSNMDIADGMQNIMAKHAHILEKAESDPDATNKVLTSIFTENSGDMVKMAQNVLGSLGLDPKKIAKQQQKKR